MQTTAVVLALFVVVSALTVEVESFCRRPYDFADWQRQSLARRSKNADIIIYAEILESPCKKPIPLTTLPPSTIPTTAPTLNLTAPQNSSNNINSSSNSNVTTSPPPPTTTQPPSTAAPTTAAPTVPGPVHNCSYELYNTTLKVLCVIKGGSMPEIIHLDGIGIDEKEMCVHEHLNETEGMYHMYDDGRYVIFLRREEDVESPHVFIPHKINYQPAFTEIRDDSELMPVFRVAGRHAHAPNGVWVNKTHEACKSYNGACALVTSLSTMLVMALVAIGSGYASQ
ncbi:uncharacterized protein LOC116614910 [Nematostella vectensis]|uniref:uncharacterized protein LOC116614910 n=1 Tax=Nematostella vectensis TaxID=45351 RepID=UPI00138FA623|nr:uncharacterized protein LOC116614910 [Nematostella vectensis]